MDFSVLSEQIRGQDVIEWIGLLTGIAYVILATYERPSCWIFGIISSVAIAWKSFGDYILIADGFLQVFYIAMGFLGLWNWISGREGGREKPIISLPVVQHVVAIALCLIISFPISKLLVEFAAARYSYLDTMITLGSIWATVLLIRKEVNNWLYWIVLDFMLIFLYYISQAYLFSVLMIIYTGIAYWGYRQWRGQMSAS